ncbi:MAG: 1,4-alpha-glucan branching protein GlgB [Campylobacterota bacterium]|nr:1,4-alpha-glucan branching protein GlgB [Campylobacterota bacterium]
MSYSMHHDVTRFGETDIYFFKEGTHTKLYNHFGAHAMQRDGVDGYYFSVWAPNASSVSVRGDFNDYDTASHPLQIRMDDSGIWEGFIDNVTKGMTYKFHIHSHNQGMVQDKSDPYAYYTERAPNSASRTWNLEGYEWEDREWMQTRIQRNNHQSPIATYELHLGSWRRKGEFGEDYLTYIEAAEALAIYLNEMNYTHVELMPVTEFPFKGSWGYQVTGYFAPTSRFGTPQEFMALVDILHRHDIGVILDWVPSHFVTDGHGLMNFDGTCLFEHEDPRLGYHPEWGSAIFNYERNEVRAFLISSAMFWYDMYHIDGIRVDAVASMLHLDYAREEGEWIPNKDGGNKNLGAIAFLRQLNETLYGEYPDTMTIAEESTAFPMVSRPVSEGGLGFGFKWNMGWMHDNLKYFKKDPIHRQHHHNTLSFSFVYMFNENYVLPLSHDEVVHMKGSLINKMPGDDNQKFAQLRALYAFMTAHPGKKLLFMGGEFAQYAEWNFDQSLDWHLLEHANHKGIQREVSELNALYIKEEALHVYDCEPMGFEWIDETDYHHNNIAFVRKSHDDAILIVCHLADDVQEQYRMGVPRAGSYEVIFDSQSPEYEGWTGAVGTVLHSEAVECHGRENSIVFDLQPISVLYLKEV